MAPQAIAAAGDPAMSTNWYSLDLVGGLEAEIDAAWRAAWLVAHDGTKPERGHAVFRASSGRQLTLYLSPLEGELAETFGAKPCEKPDPAGLRLVAGHVRAWEFYFPQSMPEVDPAGARFRHSPNRLPGFAPTDPVGLFAPTQPTAFQPTQPP
jgi:hypothetical protein